MGKAKTHAKVPNHQKGAPRGKFISHKHHGEHHHHHHGDHDYKYLIFVFGIGMCNIYMKFYLCKEIALCLTSKKFKNHIYICEAKHICSKLISMFLQG